MPSLRIQAKGRSCVRLIETANGSISQNGASNVIGEAKMHELSARAERSLEIRETNAGENPKHNGLAKLFFLGLMLIFFAQTAWAASLRVSFDMPYESGLFSKSPTPEFKARALDRAKLEIWKAYQVRLDSSKMKDVERNRPALEARLNDIVIDLSVLEEQVIQDARMVKYTVRATVNATLVDTLLSSAIGSAPSGKGSTFGFLFVPRQQSETKEFDASVTKGTQATVATQRSTVSSDQVREVEGGVEEKSMDGTEKRVGVKATTSGSVTRKAAESTWVVVESKGVDAEVTKILTENGFESSPFGDVLAQCGKGSADDLIADLVSSRTMNFNRENIRTVNDALKECEVRYFGVGFLDIDSIQRDNQTGGWMVRVAVNVNVRDYGPVFSGERRIAGTVATVQETSSGIGRTQESARDSALQEAGRRAATVVMSQMRAKGLK